MFLIFFIYTVFSKCINFALFHHSVSCRQALMWPQSLSQAWRATELYYSWAEDKADLLALALLETVLILLASVLNIMQCTSVVFINLRLESSFSGCGPSWYGNGWTCLISSWIMTQVIVQWLGSSEHHYTKLSCLANWITAYCLKLVGLYYRPTIGYSDEAYYSSGQLSIAW